MQNTKDTEMKQEQIQRAAEEQAGHSQTIMQEATLKPQIPWHQKAQTTNRDNQLLRPAQHSLQKPAIEEALGRPLNLKEIAMAGTTGIAEETRASVATWIEVQTEKLKED